MYGKNNILLKMRQGANRTGDKNSRRQCGYAELKYMPYVAVNELRIRRLWRWNSRYD